MSAKAVEVYRKVVELLARLGIDREVVSIDPRGIISSAIYIVLKCVGDPPAMHILRFQGCKPIADSESVKFVVELLDDYHRRDDGVIKSVAAMIKDIAALLRVDVVRALDIVSCMIALCSDLYPPYTRPYLELARREAGVEIDALKTVYEKLRSCGLCP